MIVNAPFYVSNWNIPNDLDIPFLTDITLIRYKIHNNLSSNTESSSLLPLFSDNSRRFSKTS